jgi:hypothetical protein
VPEFYGLCVENRNARSQIRITLTYHIISFDETCASSMGLKLKCFNHETLETLASDMVFPEVNAPCVADIVIHWLNRSQCTLEKYLTGLGHVQVLKSGSTQAIQSEQRTWLICMGGVQ